MHVAAAAASGAAAAFRPHALLSHTPPSLASHTPVAAANPRLRPAAEEKAEADERQAKLAQKQQKLAALAVKGVAAPKRLKRKATKGVRIKKHVVIRVGGPAVHCSALQCSAVELAGVARRCCSTAGISADSHTTCGLCLGGSARLVMALSCLPAQPVGHEGKVKNADMQQKLFFFCARCARCAVLCPLCMQGIKVKDAETKRQVKQVLAAEQSMRDLMMDTDEPQEKISFASGSGMGGAGNGGSGKARAGSSSGGGSKVKTGSGGSRVKVKLAGGKKGKAKAAAGGGEGMALD
jgi:hypothetical protein